MTVTTFDQAAFARRKAFTLVELLVAIAIIGLLLALLIPAMGKVRDKSKRIFCMNNVKQITLALHTYARDHKGFLPSGGRDPHEWGDGNWFVLPNRRFARAEYLWHHGYLTSTEVMTSPTLYERNVIDTKGNLGGDVWTIADATAEHIRGADVDCMVINAIWQNGGACQEGDYVAQVVEQLGLPPGSSIPGDGRRIEVAPYWLIGVSRPVGTWMRDGGDPVSNPGITIYWVRLDDLPPTQALVQDGVMQNESQGNMWEGVLMSNHVRPNVTGNFYGTTKRYRGEGAHAGMADGAVVWEELPEDPNDDGDWVFLGNIGATGGGEGDGRLMVPGSGYITGWTVTDRARGAWQNFWEPRADNPLQPTNIPVAGRFWDAFWSNE